MKKLIALAIILISLGTGKMLAQGIAVRTNVAADLMGYMNMGVDLTLNDQTTVIISGIAGKSYMPIYFKKASAVGAQLEYRHWFAHQPYEDFFLGLQVMPMFYNMDGDKIKVDKTFRDDWEYEVKETTKVNTKSNGFSLPIGFNFGYSWPINRQLNVEVSYGAGIIFYTKFYGNDIAAPKGKIFGAEIDKNYFTNFSTTNLCVGVTYILK